MSRLNSSLRGSSLRGVPGVRDLGAYLREQRENAQLSVRQLSKAAGISNPYLSQIERGLRRPSAEILQALAKGLQISAESLYVQAGLLDLPDEPGSSAPDRPDARAAICADPRLGPRHRRLLLDLYDSFVQDGAQTDGRRHPDDTRQHTTSGAGHRPEAGEGS